MASEILQLPVPADFIAGVALFDDLLREAERRSLSEDEGERNSMNIDGRYRASPDGDSRAGQPLSLYALPFVEALVHRPELVAGFAAALGDYVGVIQEGFGPAAGDNYTHLSFEDCARVVPWEEDEPPSKVIPLRRNQG